MDQVLYALAERVHFAATSVSGVAVPGSDIWAAQSGKLAHGMLELKA
jgi:hypothetical protein